MYPILYTMSTDEKRYALINAVSKRLPTPRIHELIEKGIKVNSRSKDRKTALICAVFNYVFFEIGNTIEPRIRQSLKRLLW